MFVQLSRFSQQTCLPPARNSVLPSSRLPSARPRSPRVKVAPRITTATATATATVAPAPPPAPADYVWLPASESNTPLGDDFEFVESDGEGET